MTVVQLAACTLVTMHSLAADTNKTGPGLWAAQVEPIASSRVGERSGLCSRCRTPAAAYRDLGCQHCRGPFALHRRRLGQ